MTVAATDNAAPYIQTTKTSAAAKLAKNAEASDERFKHHRLNRLAAWRRYVGPRYFRGQDDVDAQPVNTIYSIVNTFVPSLAFGGDVLADVTCPLARMRPFAEIFRLALNVVLKEMDLAGTLVKATTDAMSGPGIIYTGLEVAPPGDTEDFPNWLQDSGVAFADAISLDNYILDKYATAREAATFEGHDFQIAVEDAYDAGYDSAMLGKLQPTLYEGQTKKRGQQQVEELSRDGPGKQESDEYVPHLALRQIMLYGERVIVTIPRKAADTMGFLAEADWDGDERGPYEMLGFHYPPDNAVPVSILDQAAGMHEVINAVMRKIKSQAEREKVLGLYDLSQEEGAEAIRRGSDGQLVGVPDSSRVKEFKFGGVDPGNYESVAFFLDQQSRTVGNTDLAGGLEADEKTLGQTQLLMGQVGQQLARMRSVAHVFASRVVQKIARYVWQDPVRTIQLALKVGKTEMPVQWRPDIRQGSFEDYGIGVNLYSLQPDSPEQRYQRTMELLERVAMPLAALAAQQGVVLDVASLMRQLGKQRNLVETDEWFQAGQPIESPAGVQRGGGGRGATTNINMGGQPRGRPTPRSETPEKVPT